MVCNAFPQPFTNGMARVLPELQARSPACRMVRLTLQQSPIISAASTRFGQIMFWYPSVVNPLFVSMLASYSTHSGEHQLGDEGPLLVASPRFRFANYSRG